VSERGRPSLSPGTATPTLWAAVSALVLGRASCQPVMSSHQAALHLEVAFVDFGMVRICDVPSERAILEVEPTGTRYHCYSRVCKDSDWTSNGE
jgi:hypothetical protein